MNDYGIEKKKRKSHNNRMMNAKNKLNRKGGRRI